MDISDYRFTQTHEWVHLREGLAFVGISDHAQEEITDVVYVDLPAVGGTVRAGDELLMVDSVKASFSIYAPVGGVIEEVNLALADDPGMINSSPYGDGWLVAIRADNPSEIEKLMTEEEYQAFLATGA